MTTRCPPGTSRGRSQARRIRGDARGPVTRAAQQGAAMTPKTGYNGKSGKPVRAEPAIVSLAKTPPSVRGRFSARGRLRVSSPLEENGPRVGPFSDFWSGRRDSNPRPSPWQGDALPLSHFRILAATPSVPPSIPPLPGDRQTSCGVVTVQARRAGAVSRRRRWQATRGSRPRARQVPNRVARRVKVVVPAGERVPPLAAAPAAAPGVPTAPAPRPRPLGSAVPPAPTARPLLAARPSPP